MLTPNTTNDSLMGKSWPVFSGQDSLSKFKHCFIWWLALNNMIQNQPQNLTQILQCLPVTSNCGPQTNNNMQKTSCKPTNFRQILQCLPVTSNCGPQKNNMQSLIDAAMKWPLAGPMMMHIYIYIYIMPVTMTWGMTSLFQPKGWTGE